LYEGPSMGRYMPTCKSRVSTFLKPTYYRF
jgi:hypothetical protein